jgi:hypothetical protein
VLLGAYDQVSAVSAVSGIATIPEFLWELSLGIYLLVKGFKPSDLTAAAVPALPTPRQPGEALAAPSAPAAPR